MSTRAKYILLALAALTLAACQATPTIPVAVMSPEAQRVSGALAQWPEVPVGAAPLKRPFFATIHILGKRVTASGLLQYHSQRDFRITAVTEMGVILFDARMNWAGVTALRQMPGLDKSSVESLVRDLSVAFQLPTNLDGLVQKGPDLILKRTRADNNNYTWHFDPATGRLKETDVDLGLFDTLHVTYQSYNALGWPQEILVARNARFYAIELTFTEPALARGSQHD